LACASGHRGKPISIRSIREHRLRQDRSRSRRSRLASLFARLNPGVTLERGADGRISAFIEGRTAVLGKFNTSTVERSGDLATGFRLGARGWTDVDAEMRRLIGRLQQYGLLEYRLARSGRGGDVAIIEPQVHDYNPRISEPREDDTVVLSRFAYLRRRGSDMVLESPLAGALCKLCDPAIAATIVNLSEPQTIRQLRRRRGFPGPELLGLLLDSRILFLVEPGGDKGLRRSEGDDALVLWDFHDLLFHARSTAGRHANPSGGTMVYADVIKPLPAVRPPWPGEAIELGRLAAPDASPLVATLHRRYSTRSFDERHPITLEELSRLLDAVARIRARDQPMDDEDAGRAFEIAARPYPSGGASYELELYLAVDRCEGLARGFYHYDASRHVLLPIAVSAWQLDAVLDDAQLAMGAPSFPQILITIAARFGRVSWKYSSIAYALVLKHVGVLMQTIYLVATDMELGACAIGLADIDLFARMTGVEFHVEGTVGQMAIGRGLDMGSTSADD
jgi:SagB-type dehydrogenase family enzyme